MTGGPIGAATSIRVPIEGVGGILNRVIGGLKVMDIGPTSELDAARIDGIHKALDQLRVSSVRKESKESRDQADKSQGTVENADAERPAFGHKPGVESRARETPAVKVVVGACVSCGKFLSVRYKVILGGKIYCQDCAYRIFPGASIPAMPVKKKPPIIPHYE